MSRETALIDLVALSARLQVLSDELNSTARSRALVMLALNRDGMSYRQIGALLDLSTARVGQIVNAARTSLDPCAQP